MPKPEHPLEQQEQLEREIEDAGGLSKASARKAIDLFLEWKEYADELEDERDDATRERRALLDVLRQVERWLRVGPQGASEIGLRLKARIKDILWKVDAGRSDWS